ncbi:MAG: hypothetical protein ACO3RX_01605 [Chthoniobacterales bacterium]
MEWFAMYDTDRDSDWYCFPTLLAAVAEIIQWKQNDTLADLLHEAEYATVAVMRIPIRSSLVGDDDYNAVWDREYHPDGTDLLFFRK